MRPLTITLAALGAFILFAGIFISNGKDYSIYIDTITEQQYLEYKTEADPPDLDI